MRIKKSNPARRRSFRARHKCDSPAKRNKLQDIGLVRNGKNGKKKT